jgi:hypothetical protein
MARKVFLVCGIAASLVYVAGTIVGALLWPGYSTVDQSVSELFAIDAPSRSVVIAAFLVYDILMVVFAIGVWRSAGQKLILRVMAGLIALDQVRGAAGTLLAPIHLRGALTAGEGTSSDLWHIILTSATVLLTLIIIGLGATAFGRRFRLYSIGTIVIMVVFGALGGLQGPPMAANLPTPWLGIEERINILSFLLWYAVLAVTLLRSQRFGYPRVEGKPAAEGKRPVELSLVVR